MNADCDFARLVAQANFARQFCSLLSAGLHLRGCLSALEANTSMRELAEAIADARERIESGATVSEAMSRHPDWFGATCGFLVRAGEVGGVLDVTMEAWADMLDRELELAQRIQLHGFLARLAGPEQGECDSILQRAADDARSTRAVALFCYGFGIMLGAGVPLPLALSEAARALGGDASAQVCEIARRVEANADTAIHAELAQIEGMPAVVVELFRTGEETGLLDIMAERSADLLELETDRAMRLALAECLSG